MLGYSALRCYCVLRRVTLLLCVTLCFVVTVYYFALRCYGVFLLATLILCVTLSYVVTV